MNISSDRPCFPARATSTVAARQVFASCLALLFEAVWAVAQSIQIESA